MARKPEFPEWYKLSHEMSWRSATYSLQSSGSKPVKIQEGFFRFDDLLSLSSDIPRAEEGLWWWIYAPLLVNLLENGSHSKALWIALGHHLGRPGDTDRQWCYFLPSDWTDDWNNRNRREALYRLVLLFSYNACLPARSSRHLLLTTSLLEQLSDKSRIEERAPLLYPLVITSSAIDRQVFKWPRDHENAMGWKALDADWRKLREVVDPLKKEMLDRNKAKNITKRLTHDLRKSPNWKVPSVHFCTAEELGEDFANRYEQVLAERERRLRERIQAYELASVESLLFGDENCSTNLAYWTKTLEKNDVRLITTKSLNYLIWLCDVASPEAWSHIVSVPSWLPATKFGGRSGSIVVCVRNGTWLEGKSSDALIKEITNFISIFRLGSLNIAAEAGREKESYFTSFMIAHEVPKNLNVIDAALNESPEYTREAGLIASRYLRNLFYVISAGDKSLEDIVAPRELDPLISDDDDQEKLLRAYKLLFQSQAAVSFERATAKDPSFRMSRRLGWHPHYQSLCVNERKNGRAIHRFVQLFKHESRSPILLLILFLLSESLQGCFKALLSDLNPPPKTDWLQIRYSNSTLIISNIGTPPDPQREKGTGTLVLEKLQQKLSQIVAIRTKRPNKERTGARWSVTLKPQKGISL